MEGYELLQLFHTGEEALQYFKLHLSTIDIILLDILLKGDLNGIETANQMHQFKDVPIIFLTSLKDEATFKKAKTTSPYAYLTKPFDAIDLQRAMELAFQRKEISLSTTQSSVTNESFLVKAGNKLIKLQWNEVAWLSVDGKHTRLNLGIGQGYEVRVPLKELEEQALKHNFFRIQRSIIVNLDFFESFDKKTNEVSIKGVKLPVGRSFRDDFFKKYTLLG